MKNLKKVLALGLALVMILGMFTIASAAETKKSALDFTDWDKVEHKDAVALAVDLGIINGLPDGSFDPQGTIDRASWAKLVYFTATGDDNADAYLGTNTGMNDIKGSWAESYINYLVANKYVSGDGLGNFMPTGTVTVAAGLKTMLTVLGYDADDRGYQNDAAWMGNIMTDAKRNGLMDDVDRSQTAAVNLTRENAAQIVYNTLQANMVEAESRRDQGQSYVVSYTKKPTLGYDVFGILKVTGTVSAINKDGNAVFNGQLKFDNGDVMPNKAAVSGKVKASAAVVGEEVSVFVKCAGAGFSSQTGELSYVGSVKEVASSAVAKTAATPAATFTNGLTIADLYNSDKDDYVGPKVQINTGTTESPTLTDNVAYYVNGVKKTDGDPTTVSRGNVAEVYTNGEGAVTTVKITEWKVAQLGKDVETRTVDGKLEVRVNKICGWTAADKVDGYQGLVEDDVVLWYEGPNTTYVIEKADKVNGKVTEREGKDDDSKLTIDGTQYQQSKITGADTSFAAWVVGDEKNNEYDFFLDKNGTVCFKVLIEGETKTEVAYVLDSTFVGGNGSLTASKYAEAELLFTDGTTEIVNVAKISGNTPVAANPGKDEVLGSTVTGEGADTITGKLVDFSVNSKGNYEIKLCSAADGVEDVTDIKANAEIKNESNFVTGHRANDKTVFLVKKGTGDDAQYFVYTGKNNVPKMTLTQDAVAVEKDGVVTYAYLQTDSYEGDTPDGFIYIPAADGYRMNTDNLFVYTIYNAEGEKTTMALKDEVSAAGLYRVTKVDEANGNEVEQTAKDEGDSIATAALKTLTKIGNGIVIIGDKTSSYDKDTICVVIDLKKTNDDGVNEFDSCGVFDPASFEIDTTSEEDGGLDYSYVAVRDAGTDDVCSFIYVIRTALK